MTKAVSHLVIPDSHAHHGDDYSRYEWVSNLILERQPDVIINIGDHWDMASLSSYDKGKKSFVFKNLKDDIESGHKAEDIMLGAIVRYNSTRSKHKKKQYKPRIYKCIGNHEFRLARLLEYEPRWEGSASMSDFRTRLDIDETIIPFLDYRIIDNIAYSHYFVTGVSGRPCSSARAMIAKKAMSCTMGHSHMLDMSSVVKPTGEAIRGLICGSYHDENYVSFAGAQTDKMWWNGVIFKHNVREGDYDLEELSITRMKREYG